MNRARWFRVLIALGCYAVLTAPGAARQTVRLTEVPIYESYQVFPDTFQISPDGQWAIYEVEIYNQYADEYFSRMYSARISGGTPVLLSETHEPRSIDSWTLQFSPDGRWMAYEIEQEEADPGGGSHNVVWLISKSVDGALHALLNDQNDAGRGASSFQFTPDGRRVIFRADMYTEDISELFSIPVEGGTPVNLNHYLDQYRVVGEQFRITPDGTRVVYGVGTDRLLGNGAWDDTVTELYSLSLVDGSEIRLTPPFYDGGGGLYGGPDIGQVELSPDGQYVVYWGDTETDGQGEVFSVPITGGVPVKLNGPLPPGGDVRSFADTGCRFKISPDGQRVAYRADQDTTGVVELYSVPLRGGPTVKINLPLPPKGRVENHEFSPDSSRLVYTADQERYELYELYSAPTAGGPVVKLSIPFSDTSLHYGVPHSFWIDGDGRYVFYQADPNERLRFMLYRVPLAGGESLQLAAPTYASVGDFEVTPNGRLVVYEAKSRSHTDTQDSVNQVSVAGGPSARLNGDLYRYGSYVGMTWGFAVSSDSLHVIYAAQQDSWSFDLYATVLTLLPALDSAADAGGGGAGLTWSNDEPSTPSQYLGYAYDVYGEEFVPLGWENTIWFPFPAETTSGTMGLRYTGAYHAWISSWYSDGGWFPCADPETVILYSGEPHTLTGLSVEDLGGGHARLRWKPEIYGVWLDQITVYQDGAGFIDTQGPDGFGLWHFIDYGGLAYDPAQASFFEGWADFTLPPGGPCVFFLNARAWDAATQGAFSLAATS